MTQFVLGRAKAQMVKQMEEYYNSIRVNIQFSGSHLKVIAVTSVQPGEGKSTTSTNLAISFASAGYRTLLIDSDIRNSVMTGNFKPDSSYHGLTSYLSGHVGMADVICDMSVDNLHIIPAGQVPPNPASLLQSDYFAALVERVRDVYDYVIIDTPPFGLVVDAAIIAQKADGSLIVTESGAIRRRFIKKAVEQMSQCDAQFLGVILNKVDARKERYGAYGNYGVYGEYGKRQTKKVKEAE